jgi:hypothetical protein
MSARVLALCAVVAVTSAAYAIQPDPIYRETIIRHARRVPGEKFDPQEANPKLRATFAAADAAAERRVGNVKRDDRFVFRFWSEKKKILRRKYGIDWKTPAELNRHIAYASYGQPQITQREVSEITPVVRRRTSRPIATIKRDFRGEVTVWMKPNGNEATVYTVRQRGATWKIVDEGQVIFD